MAPSTGSSQNDTRAKKLELKDIKAREANGRAVKIFAGVQTLLSNHGWTTLIEFNLANNRRADIIALSKSGEITIVEVKSCLNDFATDQKWPEYKDYCDRFYFAVDADFPVNRLPETEGLVVADQFDGAIIRDAKPEKIAPPRRKAITLSFARTAAARLLRVEQTNQHDNT